MSDDSSDDATDDPATARDPFDQFDDNSDREGDPFASLDDGATGADTEVDEPSAGGERSAPVADPADDPVERRPAADDDPFEYADDEPAVETGGDIDDPFAGVDVPDGDPFEASAGAFEQAGVERIDPDSVWDQLTGEGDDDGSETLGEDRDPDDDPDVVEVSKHSYCEGCPHFSAPPDVACGHDGTEIIEFVDVDTVKVANCPVFVERRELEDGALEDDV